MAGPGGGPPRKSHTKSRKGCRTCKKRHIRCDEKFPQCNNCTKHNCRCDYMDMPAAGEEPLKGSKTPDLLMSTELQQRLDTWRLTGNSPIADLHSSDPTYWTRFSSIDLRLIHHIVTLSSDIQVRGYSSCTAWASKMPTLTSVSLSHDFVMSALLALSASHLAWQTENTDTMNLAYHHRGVALKGLHEAIGAFSRDNSDAILAASMLLSWQATEWRSWASLQQGVSTVMNAMRAWIHESELARYLDTQRTMARARTPSTPTFPNASSAIHGEDKRRLDDAVTALHNLKLRLSNNEELADYAERILKYVNELRQDFPIPAPETAFNRLQALRDLVFWLPPAVLHSGESDLAALTLLSHLFGTALALEPVFPEIGGAYLGTMCLQPAERIHDILQGRRTSQPHDSGCQVAVSLIEVPMQITTAYKQRQSSIGNIQAYRGSPHASPSPYLGSQIPMATPHNVPASLYSNSPVHTPQGPGMAAGSFYSQNSGSESLRRDSPSFRPQALSERSLSAGNPYSAMQMYGQQQQQYSQHQSRSSHDSSSRADYFSQSQSSYPYYGGVSTHPRQSDSHEYGMQGANQDFPGPQRGPPNPRP